jgi:hypothetical protein
MTRRSQTYAIRLAVEGDGQVRAELVSVGQSGEQSLKRIETGGENASLLRAPVSGRWVWRSPASPPWAALWRWSTARPRRGRQDR